jgi:hypothetical protein
MSPLPLGLAVAALVTVLWQLGLLAPTHPQPWSSLDLRSYFFPTYEAFYGALRAGGPMLWNPYQLCGMPWLGTLQGGFFYPPHALYLILPTSWALALSTMLHLALAAGGTAAFARRAGVSAPGATLAAMVFACAGLLRTMQLWPYFLETGAWLPFGGLAVLALTDGRPARGAIGLALASAMSWLAGSPQATVFSCYAWAALLVARLAVARPPAAAWARAIGGFVGGLAGGVLLGAVALLPALELAAQGVRRPSTLGTDLMFPIGAPPPHRVWSLWLGTGSRTLLLAALGLAPLAFLARSPALALWGAGVAGLAALFALGPATPLFDLYRALPVLAWFRTPHRVLLAGQFALAMLAALGLDAATARLRWRWAPVAILLALLVALAIDGARRPEIDPPLPYRERARPYGDTERDAYARLATTTAGLRVWPFSPGLMHRALPPKLPTLARLRSIEDYEPLSLRRHLEYFGFFADGTVPGPRRRDDRIASLVPQPGQVPPATRRRLLDLAGVRFMVVPPPTRKRADVDAFVRDAGLEPRPPLADGLEVFENPNVLPRAFVTYRAPAAPSPAELLPILASPSFDPLAQSWVEGNAGLVPDGPARGAAAIIVRDDPHVVEIDATLAAPGLVVLADTYYPGWTATVDGIPARILATNHLFRGVGAPAGTHRVRFAYRPGSLRLGAALSLLTAFALAAGAYRLQTRARA